MASQLLNKIFDAEMPPLNCVPDTDEASLLMRTLAPRMEIVEDDLEAKLDDTKEVELLVNSCDQNCSCSYLDELLREHLVSLSESLKKTLDRKKSAKEINRCLAYLQSTFCRSEIYLQLNIDKADFTFEE